MTSAALFMVLAAGCLLIAAWRSTVADGNQRALVLHFQNEADQQAQQIGVCNRRLEVQDILLRTARKSLETEVERRRIEAARPAAVCPPQQKEAPPDPFARMEGLLKEDAQACASEVAHKH